MITLDHLAALAGPAAALREAALATDFRDVNAVSRLRRDWPVDLVASALDLAVGDRLAADRFQVDPDAEGQPLWLDRQGAEQASGWRVAQWKARRFTQALSANAGDAPPLLDLCCGVGADLDQLHRAWPGPVIGVDRDPARAWMASRNVPRAAVIAANVDTLAADAAWVHLDPARRDDAGRRHRLADHQPGPDTLLRFARQADAGAIKLGPGVDRDDLHERIVDHLDACELEWISHAGRLVRTVAWTGRLAHASRSAAVIRADVAPASVGDPPYSVITLAGEAGAPDLTPEPGRWLHVPDPAVERAELLGLLADHLDAGELHPGLGLLTGDQPAGRDIPAESFEAIEIMPWRQNRVRQALRALGAGEITVRTRDKTVNPDQIAAWLRGKGDAPFTVFVLRLGVRVEAWITRRADVASSPPTAG